MEQWGLWILLISFCASFLIMCISLVLIFFVEKTISNHISESNIVKKKSEKNPHVIVKNGILVSGMWQWNRFVKKSHAKLPCNVQIYFYEENHTQPTTIVKLQWKDGVYQFKQVKEGMEQIQTFPYMKCYRKGSRGQDKEYVFVHTENISYEEGQQLAFGEQTEEKQGLRFYSFLYVKG